MSGPDHGWGDAAHKIRKVYHLCARMTLDDKQAEAALCETFERALAGAHKRPPDDRAVELWLLKIAAHVLESRLAPSPEVSFDLLDETLRSEATRTEEVGLLTDPMREVLLWELKQGCMTAVVNCLAPGERIAFVATSLLGLSDEEAALSLGITGSALKVRLSRARKKVGDYLAPRCGHVDPRNPCQCPSRIGVALRKGFITAPDASEVRLRKLPAFDEGRRLRDAVAIYQTLPEPDPPAPLVERITSALAAGRWDVA